MSKAWWGKCKECGEEQEVSLPSNYDGPTFCEACRSCDSIEEIEEEETDGMTLAKQRKEIAQCRGNKWAPS